MKLISEQNYNVDPSLIQKWKLTALDTFMKECGEATEYTATVSQNFSIPDLIALKHFMYKYDIKRILQMAHEKFDQTGGHQWTHDKKWNSFCDVCKSREELSTIEPLTQK